MQAYRALETRFGRMDALEGACGILAWDARVMLPPGSAEGRAVQMATLKGMAHDILVAGETGDLLARAEGEASELAPMEAANLVEMRRLHARAVAIPGDLVEAREKAAALGESAWGDARERSDFKALLPYLREVLRLQVETGRAVGEALGLSVYDALLDTYDPGLRQARIDPLFGRLGLELPGLISGALERQGGRPLPLEGPFPVDLQRELGLELAKAVGFDLTRGRLDVSLHPFCGGAVNDVRMTTRYDPDECLNAQMGILHETGHSVYEQGLPPAYAHQPVGKARGMTLHESQSLIVEMQAGRSRAFAGYLAPRIRQAFGRQGPAWEADNLHRIMCRVEPGLIRVDADEVTYPAHVILRYDLEVAMVTGELPLDELPLAWNDGMRELLRVEVPNDRLGCLQDIHWSGGDFGYFPTYTLGAMAAAQLFAAARRSCPDIVRGIGSGDFGEMREWLRANVHAFGSLGSTDDILAGATGAPLEAEPLIRHLRERYLEAA